jgi:hypothetical protein
VLCTQQLLSVQQHIAFCHITPPSRIVWLWNARGSYIKFCSECFLKQIVKTPGGELWPGIRKAEPPAITGTCSSALLFTIPASVPAMSSDLQSTLELLQMNDYVSRMVIHTSDQ